MSKKTAAEVLKNKVAGLEAELESTKQALRKACRHPKRYLNIKKPKQWYDDDCDSRGWRWGDGQIRCFCCEAVWWGNVHREYGELKVVWRPRGPGNKGELLPIKPPGIVDQQGNIVPQEKVR